MVKIDIYTREQNCPHYETLSKYAIAKVTTEKKIPEELANALTAIQFLHLQRLERKVQNQ